jgi:hypothetical protein
MTEEHVPPIRRLARRLVGEPRPPVWMRIALIIPIPVGAFLCAYFHLCHIWQFQIGAVIYLGCFILWKRLWWNPRQKASVSGSVGMSH